PPQSPEGRGGHPQRAGRSRSARQPRWFRRLAGRTSPAGSGRLETAVPEVLPPHRRRDRERIPDEPRRSARRASRRLPGDAAHPRGEASVDGGAGLMGTTFLVALDLMGTFVFAISGATVGV